MTKSPAKGSAPAVLVIGEAVMDIVDRRGTVTAHVGGSPTNVAVGAARLGADVELLTSIGDDEFGRRIAAHVEASGAHLAAESWGAEPTSVAKATITADGSATYDFELSWHPAVSVGSARRLVHAGSIALFLEPGAERVAELVKAAAGAGAVVTIDPNIRAAIIGEQAGALAKFERLARLADAVKLSDEDADWLYPGLSESVVVARIAALGPAAVLLTRGENGVLVRAGAQQFEVSALLVDVVDTIGAGDAFMASLVADLADEGRSVLTEGIETLARRAVAAAALTVAVAGANPPTRGALEGLVRSGSE